MQVWGEAIKGWGVESVLFAIGCWGGAVRNGGMCAKEEALCEATAAGPAPDVPGGLGSHLLATPRGGQCTPMWEGALAHARPPHAPFAVAHAAGRGHVACSHIDGPVGYQRLLSPTAFPCGSQRVCWVEGGFCFSPVPAPPERQHSARFFVVGPACLSPAFLTTSNRHSWNPLWPRFPSGTSLGPRYTTGAKRNESDTKLRDGLRSNSGKILQQGTSLSHGHPDCLIGLMRHSTSASARVCSWQSPCVCWEGEQVFVACDSPHHTTQFLHLQFSNTHVAEQSTSKAEGVPRTTRKAACVSGSDDTVL